LTDPGKLARMFKILSVNTRIQIIQLLKGRSLCVNAMAHTLQITPAAVSQHLRIMRDAEIVIGEKRGYFMHYRINEAKLAEWSEAAREIFKTDD
jgi:ArsR family transcriptional regulator